MLSELASVLTDGPNLALEGRRDVDDVINVIAHDQENFANAVRAKPGRAVGRVEERSWGPEVAGLDDG